MKLKVFLASLKLFSQYRRKCEPGAVLKKKMCCGGMTFNAELSFFTTTGKKEKKTRKSFEIDFWLTCINRLMLVVQLSCSGLTSQSDRSGGSQKK